MVAQKIVLIGAGSIQFGLETMADVLLSDVLKGSTVVLHDINQEALDKIYKIGAAAIEGLKLEFKLESTISRNDALEGADFIISAIEVSDRFKLWEQDYEIPLKYGNKQTFGENGGPGGMFHALRIIPKILEICEDIQQICPNSYFINFSNPMSRICLAIYRKFPKLKVIGLCHEIGFLGHHLPNILKTSFDNFTNIKAGGLNHFGVLLEIQYKDTLKDAYPDILANAPAYFEKHGHEVDLIKYILKHYHVLPYTTDSHFSEYIHWGREQADMDAIQLFYKGYKALCQSQPRRLRRFMKGTLSTKFWLKPSNERAIPIIEGILTDSGQYELSVNLPNTGIIEGLFSDLVVECPATVDKKGVHGVKLEKIPKGILGLWRNQASVQDLVVETALTQSKEIALQALLVDPVVDSATSAEKILDEMLRLQADYLKLS